MKVIWKYPFAIADEVCLTMPRGAEVLCVQMQGRAPCIWALVDDTAAEETRRFAARGTGHSCDGLSADSYIGTVQLHGGALVFHLFEVQP